MSEMNRRNGSMMKVVIFVVVGLSCIYFIYLDHNVRTRLHDTETTAHRYRKESESLSSKINDLQATHNDLRERSNKDKDDYSMRLSECNEKHSKLKSQHNDIVNEYGKIKQQFDKLQEDQKSIESQRVSEYMKYKQEKELEVSNLKDELANLKREKDSLSNNVAELQKSLQDAQLQSHNLAASLTKLETEKAALQRSVQELMSQQQQHQLQHAQNGNEAMQGGQLGGNQQQFQNQQQPIVHQANLIQPQNNAAPNLSDQFKHINDIMEQKKPHDTSVNQQLPDVNDNSRFQIQPAKDSHLDGIEQGAGQKPVDNNPIDESFRKQHEEDQQQRKQVMPPDIDAAEEKAKEQEQAIKREDDTKQGESFGINVPAQQHDEQNKQVAKPVLSEDEHQLPQPGPLKFDNAVNDQQPVPFRRNLIRPHNIEHPGIEIQHQDDGNNVMQRPFGKHAHHGDRKDDADKSEIYEEEAEDNDTYGDNKDDDGYNNYEDEGNAGAHIKP